MNRLWRRYGLFYVRYMDDFVIMAPTRHKLRRAIKEVHATKRCVGQRSNGFDFLGHRVVPGRHCGLLLRVDAALLRNSVGFTSRGPTTVASGGMRSVGVAGGGLGWTDWCRLKEDCEGS